MRSLDSAPLPLTGSSGSPVPSAGLESLFYLLFVGTKDGWLCVLCSVLSFLTRKPSVTSSPLDLQT